MDARDDGSGAISVHLAVLSLAVEVIACADLTDPLLYLLVVIGAAIKQLPRIHQVNSLSPALPNSPITNSSSPHSAIFLAASAPTSLLSPNCLSRGLGITMPCELPICLMAPEEGRIRPNELN